MINLLSISIYNYEFNPLKRLHPPSTEMPYLQVATVTAVPRISVCCCVFAVVMVLVYVLIDFFAYSKGGNLNINIWVWFDYFIC